jgi:hypothetical protein
MKKLILLIAFLLAVTPTIAQAAGSWSSTVAKKDIRNANLRTVTWSFTAADDDGTVPDLTVAAADLAFMEGWFLYLVEVNPGSTGPSDDAWDIAVTDANGYDITGGQLVNLDSSDTEMKFLKVGAAYAFIPLDGTALTISIAQNSVNSATASIKFYLAK